MTERRSEKPGDVYRRNVLRNLYSIWSFIQFGPKVVEKWLWTDGGKDGRKDEAVSRSSGSMINNITIAINKLDISKNCNFTKNPAPFFPRQSVKLENASIDKTKR